MEFENENNNSSQKPKEDKMSFIKQLFTFRLFRDYDDEIIWLGIGLSAITYIFAIILFFGTFGIIDEGERGIKITLGKVHTETTMPGVYFKLPLITRMKVYEIRTIKEDRAIETYTKDIQTAKCEISISYALKGADLKQLYAQFGTEWKDKLIWNNLNQSAKDIIGKYDAEKMIEMRDEVATKILSDLNERVKSYPIEFSAFQLINIDYNDAFETAVESKVIAQQAAKEAENKTKQIEQEAKQRVIAAKAEAESMKIRSQALASNPKLTDYEAVQKWDGKLPQIVGSKNMPFINMKLD